MNFIQGTYIIRPFLRRITASSGFCTMKIACVTPDIRLNIDSRNKPDQSGKSPAFLDQANCGLLGHKYQC